MKKISVLFLLIGGIALGGIGGYFFVLNYEQSGAKQPLSEEVVSSGKGTHDTTPTSQNSQSYHMNPHAYLRPYDNKVILPSELHEHSQSEQKAYLRPYDNRIVEHTFISTRAPTPSPTSPVTLTRTPTKPVLISAMKPVTSDVRGNLGPASAITNERMEDWLTDRWQAARNMGGDPIPGEHWVEIDLEGLFYIDKVFIDLVDWEVAFSNDWTIQVKSTERGAYTVLCQSKDIVKTERPHKMHVLQHIPVPKTRQSLSGRFVKLVIHRPTTRFGSSIWRMQLWGTPAA